MRDLKSRNEHLRHCRIQRNWRQQDLADQLQTTLVTIQRWERGTQHPSAYYRTKLCMLFGLSGQELGFVEEVPSLSEGESSEVVEPSGTVPANSALWTVPYVRNPHFTGRGGQLSLLEQRLAHSDVVNQPGSIRQVALTQAQAITGLGGIGKTQIAVEYAYRARVQERYTHTLWITAASEEAVLSSFAALADLLPNFAAKGETDQRQLTKAVIGWLELCVEPWLLIFDNADDLSFLPSYLPRRGNGNVLITTRASAVGSLASPIEVETMDVMEGIQLLLRRAQHFADASNAEMSEAGDLVAALGQFPLALDQAGAYIEETRCSVGDYLQIYRGHRSTLLARRGMQVTGYPESVATTWSLSFERIEWANPAASDLLRLCAFLAPDHIPEELLTEGATYWPEALREAVSDPLCFNHLLEDLLQFSVVKRLAEAHQLSVHRLVQVVQRERLEPEEQRLWAERLVRAVHSVFPHDSSNPTATWPLCQRYLEQAQACDALIQEYQLLFPEAAELLDWAGAYLRECALYIQAEPLCRHAFRLREQLVGPEHPDVAVSLNGLASLSWRQGKYAEAVQLHQRALHIREQQLGLDHPDTAMSLNNLALNYYHQRKYSEADPLFLQALCIREQQLGAEHSAVAETLNNLGLLYWQQGKYEQAEPLHRRALLIREQHLGAGHPLVAESLNNLGLLYSKWGKYIEAEQLYLQAVRIQEQQLGPEHPLVTHALGNLGLLYSKWGKYEQAEPLQLRVLRIREQRLEVKHLEYAHALNNLGLLYSKWGKYEQVEPPLLQALHIREEQLGADHSAVAETLNNLANHYHNQGKHGQAEPLYQRVLSIWEQQEGLEYPGMALALQDFAHFLQARGRAREAMCMYQRALTLHEHLFGADHPLTNETRGHLYTVLLADDRMLSG